MPGRSGSARAGSIPAASIAARPSSRRLVPRTGQPSASSRSPERLPRQPQPTISARATGLAYAAFERAAAAHAVALVLGDLALQVRLGQLRRAAAAAHLVLGLDHLLDVVDLVLRLDLGRAGRLPVDQIGAAAGVEVADDEQDADQEGEDRHRRQDEAHGARIRAQPFDPAPV